MTPRTAHQERAAQLVGALAGVVIAAGFVALLFAARMGGI